jgi:gliding motility-associated-like protein
LDYYLVTDVRCHGESNGSIEIAAQGGVQPYTYILRQGGMNIDTIVANIAVFNNLSKSNYQVSFTDATGCDNRTVLMAVDEPAPVSFSVYYEDIVCHGDSGTLIIDAEGGVEPYSFTINGGSQTPFVDSSLINMPSGVITINVYDDNNCMAPEDTTIEFTNPPLITIDSFYYEPIQCAGDSSNLLFFSATGGEGDLIYSIDNLNYQDTARYTNVPGGPITLFVQDPVRGCLRTFDTLIVEPQPIVIDTIISVDPATEDSQDGSIAIQAHGGTDSLLYSIDNGISFSADTFFTSLDTGRYDIVVQDINGCSESRTVYLAGRTLVTDIDFTEPLCHGADNGSITLTVQNGTGPYTFSIDGQGGSTEVTAEPGQNSYTFDGLSTGEYDIYVEDIAGRTFELNNITLAEPTPVTINSVYFDEILCADELIDSIEISASGGTGILSYSLDSINFVTTSTFRDIQGGPISVYVKDQNECIARLDTHIVEPAPIQIDTILTTIVSGEGREDGSITILANGGTGPLEYSIDNGQSFQADSAFNDLPTGIYDVIVRDQNGCTLDTIAEITGLAVMISDILPSCYGMEDGAIIINVNEQGQSPFIFSIDGEGGQTQGISLDNDSIYRNLPSGTYDIFVQDAFGRIYRSTYFLDQPEQVVLTANTSYAKCQIPIDGTDIGTITLEIDGGTMPYEYLSVNDYEKVNDSTFRIENLLAGEYVVNITDANRCDLSDTITVESDPQYRIPINLFTSPSEFPACFNTVVDLTVDPENTTSGSFVDAESGEIVTSSEFYSFTLTEDTELLYQAVNDTAGCMNEEVINAQMHPRLNLELIEDTVLLSETSTYLIPSLNNQLLGSTQFRWVSLTDPSHLDYLNDPYIAYPIFTAPRDVDSVTYELVARTSEGCNENDTIAIKMVTALNFPSGFTPNGDGANDEWIISEALLGRAKVEIFNRWGNRVFYSDGYSEPWDGTYNGKPLPIGTYYYVVTIKIGDAKPVTGTVTIMR